MELQEFVQASLVQIVRGIEGATKELADTTAVVSPRYIHRPESGAIGYAVEPRSDKRSWRRPVETVEFDVAVVALEGAEKKGGIGVMIGSVGIGGQRKAETSSTSHSRLKFQVPIVLPSPAQE